MKHISMRLLSALLCVSLVGLAGCGSASQSSSSSSAVSSVSSSASSVASSVSSSASSAASSASSSASSAASSVSSSASSVASSVSSSAQQPEAPAVQVRAAVLKGPTAIGMVKLMSDAEAGASQNQYTFSMSGSADEVVPAIVKGDIDIAAVPANLASVLYNKTQGGVQLLAINNLGVLYIVESGDTIHSVEDLRGKTLYSTGKGTTPEYVLNYILKENGLDPQKDLTVEYKSEASEVAAMLAQDAAAVAMLPQPFVTSAQMNNDKLRVALDMTAQWDELQKKTGGASALVTGVVIARTAFVQEHPEAVEAFLQEYQASCQYTAEDLDGCAALVEKYGIVAKAAVAKKAIPFCNIAYFDGAQMKEKVEGYLEVLHNQNPQSVGGTLPGADFYYGA